MLILKRLSDGLFIQDEDQTMPAHRLALGDGGYLNRPLPDMDDNYDIDNAGYAGDEWDFYEDEESEENSAADNEGSRE